MVFEMKCAAVLLMLLPTIPMAQKLAAVEAHTHGVGRVAISMDSNQFTVILAAPGMDVVGFEHSAENDEERAEVAAAISDLSEPLRLFNLPSEAGCETASANVALVGVGFGQVDDKTENHTREHAEFQADYVLECEEIDLVTSIRFTYFELFPDAQKLDVSLISVEGAFSYTVYRDQPVLTLQD